MKRAAVRTMLLALLAAVVGCSFVAPPIRYFEVRPAIPEHAKTSAPVLPPIIIPDFSCVAAYDNLRVVMRKSPVEVLTSRSLQWTTVPGRMIAQGFRLYMESTGRFQTVRRDQKPKPPYSIEGQVQVIELNEVPKMSARLAMHLNVRRNADDAVIAEEYYDESRDAAGNDPGAGVTALRELYGDILARASAKLIEAIAADVKGAAR
jgi:ABC-type uncharacterized transport system auxiliary subunit